MGDPLRARTTLPLPVVAPKADDAGEDVHGPDTSPTGTGSPAVASETIAEPTPPLRDVPDVTEVEDGKRPLDQSEIRALFNGLARSMDPTLRKVAPESEAAHYVEPHALPPRNPTGPAEPAIIVRNSAIEPLPLRAPEPSAPPLVSDTPPVVDLPASPLPPPGTTTVQTRPLRSRKSRTLAFTAGAGGAAVLLLVAVALWHGHAPSPQPTAPESLATAAVTPLPPLAAQAPAPSPAAPSEAPSPPSQVALAPSTGSGPSPVSPDTSPPVARDGASPVHGENAPRVAPPAAQTRKAAPAQQLPPQSSAKPTPNAFPSFTEERK